jgi:alanyl aminopeptidase
MSNKIVDKLHPEWQWQAQRVVDRAHAMDADTLASARKIHQPVESRNDLANAFDRITYQKGAAVLAMFESWMGEGRFGDGVRSYLRRHAWGNATSRDFIAALAADDTRVAPAIESFIEQVGTPRISVALRCEGAPRLQLSQSTFLALGSKTQDSARWQVPVCVRYRAGNEESHTCTLLANESMEIPLARAQSCPDWVEPDHLAAGYYRSRLEGDLTVRLIGAAQSLALPEQVGLLDNAAALARSGDQSMADALALALRLAAHARHEVVEGSAGIVAMLGDDVVAPALRPGRARLIDQYYGGRARKLGFMPQPADDDNVRKLRAAMVKFAGLRGEDALLRNEMLKATQRWFDDRAAVDGLLVEPMLKAAAVAGDRALFERFLAQAKRTQDRRERGYLLSALGHFRDPQIARDALRVTLSEDFESRDSIAVLQAAMANDATRGTAFDFMQQNYSALEAALPREFTARFPLWAGEFCTAAARADMAAFFAPRMAKVEGGPRNLAQALERVDLCLAFKQAQQASIRAFLNNY